jgi:hypothetical protein
MHIIPLGDNCAISMILNELSKRKKSYPFDWISSVGGYPSDSSIKITIELFIELLKTKNPYLICEKLLGKVICDNNKTYNTIIFPHDNGTVEEIHTKYLRRMTRLYNDIIDDEDKTIIIITRYYYIPEETITNLINMLIELKIEYNILFYSGINHTYCNKLQNIRFTYIPYDISTIWEYDYSHFRPQLKLCLEKDLQNPKKQNLSILITGQVRTFFNNNEFTTVLNRCINYYSKILIICVVNSNDENEYKKLSKYFSQFTPLNREPIMGTDSNLRRYNLFDVIFINYTDEIFKEEYKIKIEEKYNNPNFIKIREEYLKLNTSAHKEIPDPKTSENSIRIQFHQISIAVKKLIEYQNQNNISFDVTFKTRFDIKYPEYFFPHIPKSKDILDILSFNEYNKQLLVNSMKAHNLYTLDDLIHFNKSQLITLPDCRVMNNHHWDLAFGGDYQYNYLSLEYIKNGESNIVYSFGSFFEFGKTSSFLLFEKLFDNFWEIEPPTKELLYHYYAPESQIQIFCIYNKIPVLFYKNSSFLYIR